MKKELKDKKKNDERYQRRASQRTTNLSHGRTASPPTIVERDHHPNNMSEGEESEVEKIFFEKLYKEQESFQQKNLDGSEDEYLVQDKPLGS